MNELDILKKVDWLSSIWQQTPDANAKVVATPDEFFERIYESPYEDWCVKDHASAEQLQEGHKEIVKNMARHVYEMAWGKFPQPEFCGLLYDDVYSIAALLIISNGVLQPFTQERLAWYQKGRVPCGYEGEFPNGIWVIA